jgi:coproporphyrinogen III oxidase-like Fe-S oxidoreductase
LFSSNILKRFDLDGSHCSAHLTVNRFVTHFDADDCPKALATMQRQSASLCVQVPFRRPLCYCCACSEIIGNSATIAGEYLQLHATETALVKAQTGTLPTTQIALGSGTPNFLQRSSLSGSRATCMRVLGSLNLVSRAFNSPHEKTQVRSGRDLLQRRLTRRCAEQ